MRRTIVWTLACLCGLAATWSAYANQTVIITALVGEGNKAPTIVSVNPNLSVNPLPRNSSQNYTVYYTDPERDAATFTVTPAEGFATPTSGSISTSEYDTSSGAYVDFTHLTPSSIPGTNPYTITITINDGANTVSTNVSIYVY